MTSRPLPSNSTFLTYRVPGAGLRLTADEWDLIVGALRAYRHNTTYRPLYEKLAIQTPDFTEAGVRSGLPGSRPRLNLQVPPAR